MHYFEDPKHRARRQSGYDACFTIGDVAPFVGVWNRFVERWNEVESDRAIPLVLHHREFAGAKLFTVAALGGAEYIIHPDFLVQIFFRRRQLRFPDGLSCCRLPITAADVLAVECHYRTGYRDAVYEWLAAEEERFARGRNSYDTVIAYGAASPAARAAIEHEAARGH